MESMKNEAFKVDFKSKLINKSEEMITELWYKIAFKADNSQVFHIIQS